MSELRRAAKALREDADQRGWWQVRLSEWPAFQALCAALDAKPEPSPAVITDEIRRVAADDARYSDEFLGFLIRDRLSTPVPDTEED